MRHLWLSAGLLLQASLSAQAQVAEPPQQSASRVEDEIFQGINQYRATLGLPPVPRSRLLDLVAKAHVADLAAYHPDEGTDGRGVPCNAHSWSSHGSWTPVCYTADHAYAADMWNKPRQVTKGAYPGDGYEIAIGPGFVTGAAQAVAGWKASAPHNAVIAEQGIWAGAHWQAMGVGVAKGYAVVWFGKERDPSSR